jgi:glyoxylase-like metal-dependent hydrolase (beta-lactamase superfamily II)
MTDEHTDKERKIVADLRDRLGIHLFRVSTPVPSLKVNIYFMERPVPTLIDVPPDSPRFLNELETQLRTLSYSTADIERIIVTHHHPDHCGSAQTIVDRSGAEVWVDQGTSAWLENFDQEYAEELKFNGRVLAQAGIPAELIAQAVQFFRFLQGFARGAKVSRYLVEEASIELSSRLFRVERVPGHTPWCIMLCEDQEQIAFTGDFLLKDISSNPLIQRSWKVAGGYRSLDTYVSSLERVRGMNLNLVLPGHGGLLENPSGRIEELIGLIRQRRELITAALEKYSDRTPFEMVKKIFPAVSGEQLFLAVSEIMAHLQVLLHEGIAKKTGDDPLRFALA